MQKAKPSYMLWVNLTNIEEIVDALEKTTNICIDMTHGTLLWEWHESNVEYTKFLENRDLTDMRELFKAIELSHLYDKLANRCIVLYNKAITLAKQEQERWENPNELMADLSVEDKDSFFDMYAKELKLLPPEVRNDFVYNHDILQCLSKDGIPYESNCSSMYLDKHSDILRRTIDGLCKTLEAQLAILKMLVSHKQAMLERHPAYYSDIISAIQIEFVRYCKTHRTTVLRTLKNEVNRLKGDSLKLTQQVWYKKQRLDDEAYDLALEGKFADSTDERFCPYPVDVRKKVESNRDIVYALSHTFIDEELISAEEVLTYNKTLINSLDNKNIQLLFYMILRRNLIQTEIYPELKKQYKSWLEKPSKPRKSENNKKLLDDTNPLLTPEAREIWELAKDAGYVDEDLKPLNMSENRASVLAKVIGTQLNLIPLWSPFEEFWGMKKLDGKYSVTKERDYFPDFWKELTQKLTPAAPKTV